MRVRVGLYDFIFLFSSREARILSIKVLANLIPIPGLSLPEHPLKYQQAYVVGGLIKGRKTSLIAITVSCTADVMSSPQYVQQAPYYKIASVP